MAVMGYLPSSWEEGGLNWDDPDPTDYRYYAAVLAASLERLNAAGNYSYWKAFAIGPGQTPTWDTLGGLYSHISEASRYYYRAGETEWLPVLNSMPDMLRICNDFRPSRGILCSAGSFWLKWAKRSLDEMRYLQLNYTREDYLKSFGTWWYCKEKDAAASYNYAINELQSKYQSMAWERCSRVVGWMGEEVQYEEYYPYKTPGQPYWVKYSFQAIKSIFHLKVGSFRPDVLVYAGRWGLNPGTVRKISGEVCFPNDQIVADKLCRLTNFTAEDGTLDFSCAFDPTPAMPQQSEFDYSGLINSDPSQMAQFYISGSIGLRTDLIYLVGDYFTEGGFQFKPKTTEGDET